MGRGTGPRLELAHIQSCRLRSLSDRRFSEHHDAAVFSQVGAFCPLSAHVHAARLSPPALSRTHICRSSSRSGTGSAAWTCSRDVSTTWSTCSATIRPVPAATAGNSGTRAFTQTSGSGQCAEEWSRSQVGELHSSGSDRNYLEYVAESVSDWTREEELKREAAKAQSAAPAERPEGASGCRGRLVC